MRLIEKECPNCGAGLSFTKEDTTCKCEYCKREFEIERDPEKKKLVDQFSLSELRTPFKIFSFLTLGSFATHAIMVFVVAIIIVGILGFGIIAGLSNSNSFDVRANYVTSPSDLSSSDYNTLDLNSRITISKETIGITKGFVSKENYQRVKLYIVYKRARNYLIPVYKVTYEYFSNSDIKYDVYVPVIYKNVKSKNGSISFSLNNGSITDTEYHFNEGGYTYGYGDIESLYDDIIKPYEKRYKIVEK